MRWGCRFSCVLFVSRTSGIAINISIVSITYHSQSAKDINRHFKFRLHVQCTGHRKTVVILPNWLRKSEEQVKENKDFLPWMWWNPLPLGRQATSLPLSYYCFPSYHMNKACEQGCQVPHFHIRALRHVWSLLSVDIANSVAGAIVGARLDYSNLILYSISDDNISTL